MPDHTKDRAIDGLAQRQHGVFHHRQAVSKGFTRAERRSRIGRGRWVRLLDSQVFALPSHPGTWERQAMAGVLSVPASALGAGSGGALHRFPDHPRTMEVDLFTKRGGTHVSAFGTVHECCTIGRLTVVDGIRVASKADCVLQVAPQHHVESLGDLIDVVARDDRRFLPELRDLVGALAGSRLPQLAVAAAALDTRGPGYLPPASELDRRLRRFLAAIALPPYEFEATPPWVEPGAQRVDVWFPTWQLVLEADGRAWHTRVADFERDRERDQVALAHGAVTLRVSWHQLVYRTATTKHRLLAAGAHRVGAIGRAATSHADALWVPAAAR